MQQEQEKEQGGKSWRELVSILWFVLVAVAFFGPVLGGALPMGILTALYALVVLLCGVVLALSLSGQKGIKKRVE